MKQLYNYNHLVRTYYRTKHKLHILFTEKKNLRKQDILLRRLQKLFTKLSSLQYLVKKGAFAGLLTAGVFFIQPSTAKAQVNFVQHPVYRPFGLDAAIEFLHAGDPVLIDMDSDGDLDIFSGQFLFGFLYTENFGTPAYPVFDTAIVNPFSITTSGYTGIPAFIDLDGDSDMDLFEAGIDGNMQYYENTGSASAPVFTAPVTNPFSLSDVGSQANPAFADLDNDGDFDLFSGELSGNFYYFENTGSATLPLFAAPVINPFSLTATMDHSTPDFADLDHDGDMDMLATDIEKRIYYFKNTGSFAIPLFELQINDSLALHNCYSPGFGDLDNDGDLDILSEGFSYFKNYGTASSPNFKIFPLENTDSRTHPAFADIDADGDPDMITGDWGGDFEYYKNEGTAENFDFHLIIETNPFSEIYAGGIGIEVYSAPAFADIDADGDFDLMAGDEYGDFNYFKNTGTAEDAVMHEYPGGDNPFSLGSISNSNSPAFADLDNDGDLDIMSGNDSGNFTFLERTGTPDDPHFEEQILNPFLLYGIGSNSTPAFADIDNDGDLDMLSGHDNGSFYYFENIGSAEVPLFDESEINPFNLLDIGSRSVPAFADLDNDGDMDMVSGNWGKSFFYFENTPDNNVTWYRDADGDGYGDADLATRVPPGITPDGFTEDTTDCNDADAAANPAATEICNGLDDNCSGAADEGVPTFAYYTDADADGYGDLAAAAINNCAPVSGAVTDNTDCNDADETIHPGVTETCNGIDDNCADGIDDGLPFTDFYPDADMDHYGDKYAAPVSACAPIGTDVINNVDCDDANPAINPIAAEVENSIDDDCDGSVDEGFVAIQNINTANGNLFFIHPNPAQNEFVIIWNGSDNLNSAAAIKITDATGRTVLETTGEMISGTMEKTIALSNEFKPGVYYVQVQSENSLQTHPVVIIK